MNDLISFFAMNIVGALVFLPLHVVVIRSLGGRNLITAINFVIGLSVLVAVAAGWWCLDFSSPSARLMGCVAGALSVAAYAGLYGLLGPSSVDRSVSAHIVELVYLAPGGKLKKDELFALYSHDDVLEKRFKDCIDTGIIERDGDQLTVTRRGARIAALYLFIGRFLGMRLWFLDRYYAGAVRR